MSLLGGSSGIQNTTTGATQAAASQAKLEEDLNKFLNLLVTQLKNQDPLEPMDATEFTQQLVQFASVEQQIYSNSHLESLLAMQQATQVASMVDYLGTTIESDGDKFRMENGYGKFTYDMPSDANTAVLIVLDENNNSAYSIDAETSPGRHTFEWDGKDKLGNPLPEGTYTAKVLPKDRAGNLLPVSYTVFGRVTGASADGENVILEVGDISVPMDKVLTVQETK